jgi:hypothetical protein
VSTELGAKQVNQLKVVSDNDNGKSLTLCTSIIRTSLPCDRNWPMCSYVIITVEFREIRYPKTPWVRRRIKVLQI